MGAMVRTLDLPWHSQLWSQGCGVHGSLSAVEVRVRQSCMLLKWLLEGRTFCPTLLGSCHVRTWSGSLCALVFLDPLRAYAVFYMSFCYGVHF